jgi:hypothetical protein
VPGGNFRVGEIEEHYDRTFSSLQPKPTYKEDSMKRVNMRAALALATALTVAPGFMAQSQQKMAAHDSHAGHIMLTPDELKWGDVPPALPPGAKIAVLQGDPFKAGLYTLRLKFPADYKIPAHWHPTDEHITVISGTFVMGFGDKLDPSGGKPFSSGGFTVTPAKTNHFAYTNEETVVQVHGQGPFAITYVNPADDPRNQASKTGKN